MSTLQEISDNHKGCAVCKAYLKMISDYEDHVDIVQKENEKLKKQVKILERLILLTHKSVYHVEMNELSATQWSSYLKDIEKLESDK